VKELNLILFNVNNSYIHLQAYARNFMRLNPTYELLQYPQELYRKRDFLAGKEIVNLGIVVR